MSSSTPTPQRRLAISERERQQIRQYAQANPLLRQTDIARWASNALGHKINQSIICKSLHAKWSYLDTKIFTQSESGMSRNYKADYPLLESALFEWIMCMEANGMSVTGEMMQSAASSLWHKMSDFLHLKEPAWSQGWLSGFKRRHNIKPSKQIAEAPNEDVGSVQEVQRLQFLISGFNLKDIFGADETSLFWLTAPESSLIVRPPPGNKRTNMITILPTCNADGSEKLNPWIIGHYQNPPSFGAACRYVNNLPFTWKHNKNAWMTTAIFVDYLHWFDEQMQGRKVLLLIDRFSAHVIAAKQLEDEIGGTILKNTTVAFLPNNNNTFVFHPMVQGIVHNMKVHYRNIWLQHVVSMTMAEKDPYQNTTILSAVHWVLEAWRSVTPDMISHCWRHSQLFGPVLRGNQNPGRSEEKLLQQLAQKLVKDGVIREAMSLVNSPEEVVTDSHGDLIEHIAVTFSVADELGDTAEQLELQPVSPEEALKAMNLLIRFEEQREDVNLPILAQLRCRRDQITQTILAKRLGNRARTTVEPNNGNK